MFPFILLPQYGIYGSAASDHIFHYPSFAGEEKQAKWYKHRRITMISHLCLWMKGITVDTTKEMIVPKFTNVLLKKEKDQHLRNSFLFFACLSKYKCPKPVVGSQHNSSNTGIINSIFYYCIFFPMQTALLPVATSDILQKYEKFLQSRRYIHLHI